MFEVGKRFLRIHEYAQNPCWKKGDIGVLKQINGKSGRFESERTGELYWGDLVHFDPTPIDDTPAPRMVTTCDIGARVVRGRDCDYDENEYQGGKNPIGTITEYLAGLKLVMVEWDNGRSNSYEIGDGGKFDLYYADEQPKKEAECECERCGKRAPNLHFCIPKDEQPKKEESIIGEKEFRQAVEIIDKTHDKVTTPWIVCDIKETADFFEKAAKAMKEATPNPFPCCPECGNNSSTGKEVIKCVCGFDREQSDKDDDGTDKTPPYPAPGIASIMFGSKPRLMYGSLMQIQGPTKDEQARKERTEEERKRYGAIDKR